MGLQIVLAAALFAFFYGYAIVYKIAHKLLKIIGEKIDLVTYTKSSSLCQLCITLAHTTDRRRLYP